MEFNYTYTINKFKETLDSDIKKVELDEFLSEILTLNWTISKTKSRIKCFVKILNNKENTENWKELYKLYWLSNNQYERYKITNGSLFVDALKKKYKKRPNRCKDLGKKGSIWCTEYWVDKGYSELESINLVKKSQSKNGVLAHEVDRPNKIFNSYSVEYYIERGYSEEESNQLVIEQKYKTGGSLKRYIEKFGEDEGKILHKIRYNKALATKLERYGTTTVNGRTSKESLKFFIPLYKKLRKRFGLKKEDIYWGIKGSKEFVTHLNGRNYFYDFTIKSLKVIIEYNNLFWHPREDMKFQSSYYEYDAKILYDKIKIEAMTDRGFDLFIVWNDDNFKEKSEELLNIIERKLNERKGYQ